VQPIAPHAPGQPLRSVTVSAGIPSNAGIFFLGNTRLFLLPYLPGESIYTAIKKRQATALLFKSQNLLYLKVIAISRRCTAVVKNRDTRLPSQLGVFLRNRSLVWSFLFQSQE